MGPLLLAAVVLSGASTVAPPTEPAPLPTAAELAADLIKTRAAMREVHVVVQHRSVDYAAPNVPRSDHAFWEELFLSGDAAQTRMLMGPTPPGGWYQEDPSGVPLTGETAAEHDGRLVALRPPGDGPVRVQLESKVWGAGVLSDTLYTTHMDYEPYFRPVPHIAADRVWADGSSAPNLIDALVELAETKPAGWTVEGREVKDGRPTIRVSASNSGRRGGDGEATLSGGLRAWFTDDDHHDLIRVEDAQIRWVFGEILLKESEKDLWREAAWVDDYRTLPSGVRAPVSGGEISRAAAPAPIAESTTGADPAAPPARPGDAGESPELFVASKSEWRITTLEPLDSEIDTADLWIEPPDGAQVHDVATGKESIAGAFAVESWLIVTFRNRYAAWWAFGPPLALCGVIAAAWWWRRRQRRWATA